VEGRGHVPDVVVVASVVGHDPRETGRYALSSCVRAWGYKVSGWWCWWRVFAAALFALGSRKEILGVQRPKLRDVPKFSVPSHFVGLTISSYVQVKLLLLVSARYDLYMLM
jgi:hypothetical protein